MSSYENMKQTINSIVHIIWLESLKSYKMSSYENVKQTINSIVHIIWLESLKCKFVFLLRLGQDKHCWLLSFL